MKCDPCWVCDEPMTDDDIHSTEDGYDVHGRCCDICNTNKRQLLDQQVLVVVSGMDRALRVKTFWNAVMCIVILAYAQENFSRFYKAKELQYG